MIEDFNLTSYNTFGIKSIASRYLPITGETDLTQLPSTDSIFVLGGGSNLLLPARLDALVLHNQIDFIRADRLSEEEILVEVGGGMNWHRFVTICVQLGWGGVENLALIPGSVGAAPIQNIGAYGVEQRDVFDRLRAYDFQTNTFVNFTKEECRFGYRDSIFKQEGKRRYFIVSVSYRLSTQVHNLNLSYAALKDAITNEHKVDLTIKDVYDKVIAIRQSKLPDPGELGNSGSFFKNPVITKEKFLQLKETVEDLKYFPIDGQYFKIPAGYMIESCGWKGRRIGDTGCYEKQALVVVNYGNATSKEILDFVHEVKQSVEKKFGILLEEEVNIIT